MVDKETIGFEEVTVKIPKGVMDLLRTLEPVMQVTIEEFIQYNIVDVVKSQIGNLEETIINRQALTRKFKLEPIFDAILNQ